MKQMRSLHWKDRFKASSIHLGLSLCIAALAALLVFKLWYPYPYRDSSGGRELFLLVITVDVILGPLITLAVFNRNKPRKELLRDLVAVGLIQLAALAYGLWTVFVARPVHLVFEYDRFRVVHAIEVPDELLAKAPEGLRGMPITGPTVLALRPFRDVNEEGTATLMALQGLQLSANAELWQDYPRATGRVLEAAKPMALLNSRFPQHATMIAAGVEQTGKSATELVYLPMVARKTFGTVLLDAQNAEPRAYLPLDSF